ncbi:hypothetical protein [Streptomyces sp. DfronAA-171]|uniref:hypothetical protein n=2 Tax=unclassified Streptomyces TaxID=2593676 RepID=UPI00114D2A2C|nr:hypothetical protein [Streptomyces sp. DfronAA-171]
MPRPRAHPAPAFAAGQGGRGTGTAAQRGVPGGRRGAVNVSTTAVNGSTTVVNGATATVDKLSGTRQQPCSYDELTSHPGPEPRPGADRARRAATPRWAGARSVPMRRTALPGEPAAALLAEDPSPGGP